MDQILKYFQKLSQEQIDQFKKLEGLYKEWNSKINLISRKDIDALYERHVLHSLAIAKIIEFKTGTEILDIGTGGGFPGIPLAIIFPKVQFLLIDSIRKKIAVVDDIIRKLNLKNVEAKHFHSNEVNQNFDFIVSRAVTAFPLFVKLVKGKIKPEQINSLPNGIIYLKGGDLADEIKDFNKKVQLFPISDFFGEEFFKTKFVVYLPC